MSQERKPVIMPFGKYKGKSLGQLMFLDYTYLQFIVREFNPNRWGFIFGRAKWLIEQGENRPVKVLCRICKERPAEIIPISYTADQDPQYAICPSEFYPYCRSVECQKHNFYSRALILPIKFSSIAEFRCRTDQKAFVRLLKMCFGLNGKKLDPQSALNFFNREP